MTDPEKKFVRLPPPAKQATICRTPNPCCGAGKWCEIIVGLIYFVLFAIFIGGCVYGFFFA